MTTTSGRAPGRTAAVAGPTSILPAIATLIALAALALAAPADAASKRTCFGAAARDDVHKCTNKTRSVSPKLEDRHRRAESPCRLVEHENPEPVCTFGASKRRARHTIALVGDSHALHWRAALDVVADARRWRAYSVTAPGCSFTAAVEDFPVGLREPCTRWYRQARKWFRSHPEVGTVFFSQNAPTPVLAKDRKEYGRIKIAGSRRAWRSLPRTVKHIVVIRDTPRSSMKTFECIGDAVKRKVAPGPACAYSRSDAMSWDTAVTAAKQLRSRRYGSVDLTDYFCDEKTCPPVIGGALVHRDGNHMTEAFAESLGPFLHREVRRLIRRW